jgi:hypothetical protein
LGSVLKDLGYWESGIHGKRGILWQFDGFCIS